MLLGLNAIPKELKYNYKDCNLITKFKFIKQEIKYAIQRAWIGYDKPSIWDIRYDFICLYKEKLFEFKKNLHSMPIGLSLQEWEKIIDKMISLLNIMQDEIDEYKKPSTAKDEFFDLFSKHFYDLWD